jgi:hypothetical protein
MSKVKSEERACVVEVKFGLNLFLVVTKFNVSGLQIPVPPNLLIY